jgi:hypothetical protein
MQTVPTHAILGFHSDMSKVSLLLGSDTVSPGFWFAVFQNNIVVSSSRIEIYKKNAREQVDA